MKVDTSRLRSVVAGALSCLLLFVHGAASGSQAMVYDYSNPDMPVGQAYLSHYGGECLAILPTHVANEVSVPAFLSEGTSALGEAEDVRDLGDDLAISPVTGSAAQRCGFSFSTLSRAVDRAIKSSGVATLRSVNSDGTVAHLSVAVVDNDGSTYLRVQPTNENSQIRKGQSGSMLMVGDQAVGMLLSVSSRRGVGTILRMDTILQRVGAHMASLRDAGTGKADTSGADANDLAAAANGGGIAGWSAMPAASVSRAANLISSDAPNPWRARVDQWPVLIDVDLAGDRVAIASIELDAPGVGGEAPARVEILVSTSEDETRWRSLLSSNLSYNEEGVAVLRFAPTWARKVRLAFYNTVSGSADTVSLRRVRIFGP